MGLVWISIDIYNANFRLADKPSVSEFRKFLLEIRRGETGSVERMERLNRGSGVQMVNFDV